MLKFGLLDGQSQGLVLVNIFVSSDDDSLLDPGLRKPAFHSFGDMGGGGGGEGFRGGAVGAGEDIFPDDRRKRTDFRGHRLWAWDHGSCPLPGLETVLHGG